MDYDAENPAYEDDMRGYDRDRSRSPRPGNGDMRARSASPGPRDRDMRGPPPSEPPEEDEEAARNTGSNLFVTGLHPRLNEDDVIQLFSKFGEVEKCNILRDPHTRDSRGFGFVNMLNSDQADAAKEGLQGEVHEGRTLSIEKARRSRPRTPTPGKYFGPPKHDFRGPPRRGGGRFGDRYDDRRGGYGRRDDHYGSSRGGSRYGGSGGGRYEDRYERGPPAPSYGRRDRYDDRYEDRYADRHDDRGGGDRYASSGRDDRYSRRGGNDYYDRPARRGGAPAYGEATSGKGYGGGSSRTFDDHADDRYAAR